MVPDGTGTPSRRGSAAASREAVTRRDGASVVSDTAPAKHSGVSVVPTGQGKGVESMQNRGGDDFPLGPWFATGFACHTVSE
jgi:hypothetical protein